MRGHGLAATEIAREALRTIDAIRSLCHPELGAGSHRCCRTVWLDGPMRGTKNAVPIEKDLPDEEEYVGVAATCHCSWRVDIIRWFLQAIISASRICLLLHFQRRRREPDVGSFHINIAVVDRTIRFGTAVPMQF